MYGINNITLIVKHLTQGKKEVLKWIQTLNIILKIS